MNQLTYIQGIRSLGEPAPRQLDLWRIKEDAEYVEDQFREAAHHFDMTLAALRNVGMPMLPWFERTMATLSEWHHCAELDLEKARAAYEDKVQADGHLEL